MVSATNLFFSMMFFTTAPGVSCNTCSPPSHEDAESDSGECMLQNQQFKSTENILEMEEVLDDVADASESEEEDDVVEDFDVEQDPTLTYKWRPTATVDKKCPGKPIGILDKGKPEIWQCRQKCEKIKGCTGFNRGKKGAIQAKCWFFSSCTRDTPMKKLATSKMHNVYFVTATKTAEGEVRKVTVEPKNTRSWKAKKCKATNYKIKMAGSAQSVVKLPATTQPQQKNCGGGLEGKLFFKCVPRTGKWKLADRTCKQKGDPPPSCPKSEYALMIHDENQVFELPAGQGGEKQEEECTDGSTGKVTFTCDADAKRWTLEKQGCKKPEDPTPMCQASNYQVKMGSHPLTFQLPAAMAEVKERKEDCGGGLSGQVIFACTGTTIATQIWQIMDHSCKEDAKEAPEKVDEEAQEPVEEAEAEPPLCKRTNYKVNYGGTMMLFDIPSSANDGEALQRDCVSGMSGKVDFMCDAGAGRWTITAAQCAAGTTQPVCAAMKYNVRIGDAALQFGLPPGLKDGDSKEEECNEEGGKITFGCMGTTGNWLIFDSGCGW